MTTANIFFLPCLQEAFVGPSPEGNKKKRQPENDKLIIAKCAGELISKLNDATVILTQEYRLEGQKFVDFILKELPAGMRNSLRGNATVITDSDLRGNLFCVMRSNAPSDVVTTFGAIAEALTGKGVKEANVYVGGLMPESCDATFHRGVSDHLFAQLNGNGIKPVIYHL